MRVALLKIYSHATSIANGSPPFTPYEFFLRPKLPFGSISSNFSDPDKRKLVFAILCVRQFIVGELVTTVVPTHQIKTAFPMNIVVGFAIKCRYPTVTWGEERYSNVT